MKPENYRTWISLLFVISMALTGCGSVPALPNFLLQGSGTSGKEVSANPVDDSGEAGAVDLPGSIRAPDGSQSLLTGWSVVALPKGRRSARVAEIDSAGLYSFRQLNVLQDGMTLALLSPDYIFHSVLSIPTPDPSEHHLIRQYFRSDRGYLPPLVANGPIIYFEDLNGLHVTRDLAADSNDDGVPDGMVTQPSRAGIAADSGDTGLSRAQFITSEAMQPAAGSGTQKMLQGNSVDTDLDGTPNVLDPDIDGDGVANHLDADDNGNGIPDVVDGDANGDLVLDTAPGARTTDPWFTEGVDFITIQVERRPGAQGQGDETLLTFNAAVRDNVHPLAVQVRGAPSLLNDATVRVPDANGQDMIVSWNRALLDDGMSHDHQVGDRIFGRQVTLASDKAPRTHEVVFVQLVFGPESAPWYMEFPYVFPEMDLDAVDLQFDARTRAVLMTGNPFGVLQEYTWNVAVYDNGDRLLWMSEQVPGQNRQFTVPGNVLTPGLRYRIGVSAQTLDKVPGSPTYVVRSRLFDVRIR